MVTNNTEDKMISRCQRCQKIFRTSRKICPHCGAAL